ncbi:MAG: hypothetical protein KKG95_04155 [Candidatus Omnitrophica bacterium]|nr:hypothetical protein [Candidatus Omnitrophota bacterium]
MDGNDEVNLVQKKDTRKYVDRREYLIQSVRKQRQLVRMKTLGYKKEKCEKCGYNKCIEALEFHHLYDQQKEFGISSKGYTRSWIKVKAEIDKCILVCANCHREIHAKTAALDGNIKMKTG